jgi:hypothetical protein
MYVIDRLVRHLSKAYSLCQVLNAEDATLVAIELGYDTAVVDEEKLFDIHPRYMSLPFL